ncbi:MAG TPA: hypothetical protein VKW09_13030 [bacterium]|nr:hypothetical protein [bacterium]
MVFVAGLPGTGKSLVIRELARIADAQDRAVHTLQWDVARPAFEAAPAGRRYPVDEGVTHVVIRKAAGLWVREAVTSWHRAHPGANAVLVGEAPLAGGRFIELARTIDDAAEPLLAAESCRFVIPVPSRDVRAFIEAERDRRMAGPHHPREREDAPPHVLRALWDELVSVARTLGIAGAAERGGAVPYDPSIYEGVYRSVLARRHTDTLPLTRVLPTAGVSVYEMGVPTVDIVPSADEADRAIRTAEAAYPDPGRLTAEAQRWYDPLPP